MDTKTQIMLVGRSELEREIRACMDWAMSIGAYVPKPERNEVVNRHIAAAMERLEDESND